MQVYVVSIKSAIFIFPILAALLTLPYAIHRYRKYGSIMMLRVAIVYSFVFYLICAYFLVILPLPPIFEVANYTTPFTQLQPFAFVEEIRQVYQSSDSFRTTIQNPLFFTVAFNVLLCFPLGVYFRYYFNFSFTKTILCIFLISLSFELIQLSGLLGIYPRPYRLFDVDDLIVNTFGGMVGYVFAPLFSYFLPSRDHLDELSYYKGISVSAGRRCMALFIDLCITLVCTGCIAWILHQQTQVQIHIDLLNAWICAVMLLEVILPLFLHGQTIGKRIVKITLKQQEEKQVRWFQILYHYGFLYLLFLPLPYYAYFYISEVFQESKALLLNESILLFLIVIFYFLNFIQSIATLMNESCIPLYSKPWKLHNVSTLKTQPEKEEETIDLMNKSKQESETM